MQQDTDREDHFCTVDVVQLVSPCPASLPAVDCGEVSFARHGMTWKSKEKFRRQLMTDATVMVGSRSWEVHRADLSMESPVLKDAFEFEPSQDQSRTCPAVGPTLHFMHHVIC